MKDTVRFLTIFSITALVMYLAYYFLLMNSPIMFSIKSGTASIVSFLLSMIGLKSTSHNNIVTLNGFSMEIIDECTAIFSSIVYTAAVIAYPTRPKQKIIGILLGIPLLYFIDIVRLIVLALVGISNREMFDYVHVYLWQTTFIAFVVMVFYLWIKKVVSHE